MRYERLILTTGDQAVAVRFHARFTVIAGVGPLEREGIVTELLGALCGPRPGTNLEVAMDDGRRIGVLRPTWGLGDRALDVDTGDDLSDDYRTADGRLDLLAPIGLTGSEARRLCRLGALDLMASEDRDALVSALGGQPQRELWRAADRLTAARAALDNVASGVGATAQDSAVIADVDERHRQFEQAQDRCESIRHHGIFTGMACAVGGLPAVAMNRWAAVPFAAVAAAFLAVSVIFRRRLETARRAEDVALVAAGAASYGGFLHRRVATMIGVQEAERRAISAAVAEHRKAQAGWTSLVGDVDLDWARTHQGAIATVAAGRGDADAAVLARALARTRVSEPEELAELADQVLDRVASLRDVAAGEGLPLILDEPFEGIEPRATRWLLELILRAAGQPQVVVLTADPAIVAWARPEELAGNLSVREPAPGPTDQSMAAAS